MAIQQYFDISPAKIIMAYRNVIEANLLEYMLPLKNNMFIISMLHKLEKRGIIHLLRRR